MSGYFAKEFLDFSQATKGFNPEPVNANEQTPPCNTTPMAIGGYASSNSSSSASAECVKELARSGDELAHFNDMKTGFGLPLPSRSHARSRLNLHDSLRLNETRHYDENIYNGFIPAVQEIGVGLMGECRPRKWMLLSTI